MGDPVSIAVSIVAMFLSPLLQVLLDQTIPGLLRKFRSGEDVKEELRSLGRTLSKIQALFSDVEMMEINDRSLALWLMELKDAAFDMEDLLDEFATTPFNQVSSSQSTKDKKECLEKIRKSREMLDMIVKDRHFLSLGKKEGANMRFGLSEERFTSSLVDISSVFGRNQDKDYIIKNYLCACDESGDLPVLPIVGMGGIGKTTLIQLVYNDKRVAAKFPLKIWVCVSDNFNVKRLIREILESASEGEPCAITNWDTIQRNLKKKLEKKRFLLILDDMWSEDHTKWEMLYASLLHGKKGSKVIITTRDGNVAKLTGTRKSYLLEGLSDDDSWLLFKKCAFSSVNSDAHLQLEAIGREIVQKLKGSPLAVKTIGRLLKSESKGSIWKNILESEIWEFQQDENDILPILRLSYQHLPSNLKLCFSFCSIFPKGYRFDKKNIVQIWMAHGLIHRQEKRLMEDIGSEYFDDLYSRSFFHKSENSLESDKFVIHDLMHDMAKFVSLGEFCSLGDDLTQTIPENVHHISLICNNVNLESHFPSLYELKSLRTLLFMHKSKSGFNVNGTEELFQKLQCIRVLSLSGSNIEQLPASICGLKHLRYIDLTNMANLSSLPISLLGLQNLQTLKLMGSKKLSSLPEDVSSLINLRHLEADCDLVAKVAKIGNLTSLQELGLFKVQKESGYQISELKGLAQLHGCLCIRNVENVEEADVTNQFIMSNKENLDTLELKWEDTNSNTMSMLHHHHHVFQGLRPHTNLKELIVKGYGGMESPSWMIRGDKNFLCNLETVHLCECRNWKELPSFGHMQFLKSLKVEGLDGVKEVDHRNFGTFPSLRKLHFHSMANWSKWPGEGPLLFPSLEELSIVSCPNLTELPPLSPTLSVLTMHEVGLSVLPEIQSCSLNGHNSPSLSKLYISDCPNLTSMSQLQHMVALKTLTLARCQALTSMPGGWFHKDLVSLENLIVTNCPQLTFSPESLNVLPSALKELIINGSPGLVTPLLWRDLQNQSLQTDIKNKYQDLRCCTQQALRATTALQVLRILYSDSDSASDEVELTCKDITEISLVIPSQSPQRNSLTSCLQNLTTIHQLDISGCSTITTLSRDVLCHLIALKEMTIESCENLVSLEFQALRSLQSLIVISCSKLTTCLPHDSNPISGDELPLPPLKSLQIERSSLFAAGLPNLTSLKKLILDSCPVFTSQEETWLTTITSLRKLTIFNCGDMTSLPAELQNLHCLKSLYLKGCQNIETISVDSLPSSLKRVIIRDCISLPTALRRTENWPTHIEKISVDDDDVRGT